MISMATAFGTGRTVVYGPEYGEWPAPGLVDTRLKLIPPASRTPSGFCSRLSSIDV